MSSDHNLTFVPYFAADGVVTMDALWRGEESVVQGEYDIVMFLAPFNNPNVENLAQWERNGKSLIAQKLVQVIVAGDALIRLFSGGDAKIKWRPDVDELKSMGSAFEPRWREFFQDRPDKAVAIFSTFAGYMREYLLNIEY
jgi:alcohol oxidase